MRVASILGAVLAGIALLLACSSDEISPKGLAEGCSINTDCTSPLVCAFKKCHQACEATRDCPLPQRCVAADRPYHVCQLETERNCTYRSDCPEGQTCGVDLQCRDQCIGDRDCVKEQTCVGGTCASTEELVDGKIPNKSEADAGEAGASGQPCLYTSQCPDDLICRNKICAIECLKSSDCTGGNACVNNRCVAGSGSLIGPEGGVVSSDSGKLKLTIPAGSLLSQISILILPMEAWPDGAIGPVFQISPSGIKFDPPATLTFDYASVDLGAVDPAKLLVASASGSTWAPLTSTVDPVRKTVSASLAHLSIYGIVGPGLASDAAVAPGDSGAGKDGASVATRDDAGRPVCQVRCMSDGGDCACSTTAPCNGHQYAFDCINGGGTCTCRADDAVTKTVFETACGTDLFSTTTNGCRFPFAPAPTSVDAL
ncbi:MAG TPA: hypothetical protein VJT73_00800 [Polyangiaceae bacterium]|nr:hypothetical protein [Polyangiaceae bacterium]